MDVPGFSLLNNFTSEIKLDNEVVGRVCDIEGIIILKLLAWSDRNERNKDLADIDTIIKNYFDLFSDDVYENHNDILEMYDPDDLDGYIPRVCSHLIGRKMGLILTENTDLKNRIVGILERNKGEFWIEMLKGLTTMP